MPSPRDNAGDYYDRHSDDYRSKWRLIDDDPNDPTNLYRKTVMANLIEVARVEPGDRVVEIGAGTGLVLRELLRTTSPIVGTDISTEMLGRAHEQLSAHWRVEIVETLPEELAPGTDVYLLQNDLLDLRLPAGRFDAILSMEVLRYVRDLDRALLNVGAIMGEDTVFAFTVTNVFSLSLFPSTYLLRKKLGRVDLDHELAQYFVTEQGIRRTLERLGFEVLELRKFNGLTYNPLVGRLVKTRTAAERVVAIDDRLTRVPLANRLFDTLLVAARKR